MAVRKSWPTMVCCSSTIIQYHISRVYIKTNYWVTAEYLICPFFPALIFPILAKLEITRAGNIKFW